MKRTATQRFPIWTLWLIGAVTLLAAALLIFAAVLGVQTGQRQLDWQRRQQVGNAIQQALDARAQGKREAALDAYKRALQLDPTNTVARDGIELLLTSITSAVTTAVVTTPVTAPATSAVVTQTTPATTDVAALWQAAQAARVAGRWPETLKQLLAIKQVDPAYQPQQVADLLFETYVNLARDKDNEDNLEEALRLFDQALVINADSETQVERDLISRYLDATNTYGESAIALLRDLYAQEPEYRDVADRLQESYVAYGDTLVAQSQWCAAAEQFTAAAELAITPGLIAKRDESQQSCAANGGVTQSITQTLTPLAGRGADPKTTETPDSTPLPTEATAPLAVNARGTLLYSARDLTTGQNRVYLYPLGDGSAPRILREDAAQPAFRPDGQRLILRNLRSDSLGLSALDPATGLVIQFTKFSEDSQPSWNPLGNKIVFASNREGDRLWRVYVKWADENPEVSNLGFGETPHWHPALDQIVFKGCDATGNNCGLWSMNGSGSQRAPLTTVQRDTHPHWSPDGTSVVFLSDGRDGNLEIYQFTVSNGEIIRLTNNPAVDVLPTVSPDGQWVAFLSNRDGGWKFWVVPIDGGPASLLAPLVGDLGNWQDQGLVWLR